MQESADQLQQKMNERGTILAQIDQANLQRQMAASLQQVADLTKSGDTPSFDEVKRKVADQSAQAQAATEPRSSSPEALELRAHHAELTSQADDILAQLDAGTLQPSALTVGSDDAVTRSTRQPTPAEGGTGVSGEIRLASKMVALLHGERSAAAVEAYRRAGGEVYDLADAFDRARLEWSAKGLNAWPAPHSSQVALLASWNAFALQVLGDELVAADYAADPTTAGFLPPVTARQALAFYGPVPAGYPRCGKHSRARNTDSRWRCPPPFLPSSRSSLARRPT